MREASTPTLPEWATTANEGDLFSTGVWFRHFATTALPAGEPARFIESHPASGEAGLALAMKASRGTTFPFCRMLESMANYYSCGFGPIGRVSDSALRDLVRDLASEGRRFDTLRLGPLRRDATFAKVCEEQLAVAGYRTYWTPAFKNWYAATEGLSYAQYLEKVPSSFPATSEKRRQSFLRKGTGTIVITTSEENLESELSAYTQVYDSSWKVPEPFPQFIQIGRAHV